ncbi:hypothetical protein ACOHYD_07160 [Desulfobacterota bacterium M19]
MLKQNLINNNPLGVFKTDTKGNEILQRMGLVVSRPGVGKTAILVQIALYNMLQGKQVVHVSIGQSIDKTKAWYDDIIKDVTSGAGAEEVESVKYEIIRNRMIITFNNSNFSRPKLEERLNDLIKQDIFRPSCLVIDGLDIAVADRQLLDDLHALQKEMGINIWLSAVSHRDEAGNDDNLPAVFKDKADIFDTLLMLQPADSGEGKIFLKTVKDDTGCVEPGKAMCLDPTTMLVWG